jgi:hypothetical protein
MSRRPVKPEMRKQGQAGIGVHEGPNTICDRPAIGGSTG